MVELLPWLASKVDLRSKGSLQLHPAFWKTCTSCSEYSEIQKRSVPLAEKDVIPSANPAQDSYGESPCLIGKSWLCSLRPGTTALAFPDSADWISRVWKRFPCLYRGNLLLTGQL